MFIQKKVLLCLCFIFLSPMLLAKGVYQTSEQFINSVFNNSIPKPQVIWLKAEDKKIISDILSHSFNRMRVRYWQKGDELVWILDEVGKEKPITIGVHIDNNRIKQLKVLAFRESRGDEVRHGFFTDQFKKAYLTDNNKLSEHVDGVTGATLSVRATIKVARLALWLTLQSEK